VLCSMLFDGETEQRLLYLRQAFLGFCRARQGREMESLARVICAILGVDKVEQRQILEGIDRLTPALTATTTLESLGQNLTKFWT